jgi:hypothetical protein
METLVKQTTAEATDDLQSSNCKSLTDNIDQ